MRTVLAAMLAGVLSACALQPGAPPEFALAAPAGFPDAYYRQAAAQGATVLTIDPAASVVVIEVYRGGSLARLGHDHVVASHDVRGFVAPNAKRADLYLRLDSLVVDEADLRKEAGFDTQPTDEDIAGTRRNLLNAMDAAAFPFALVRIAGIDGGGEQPMRVTVSVHGVERTAEAPVDLQMLAGSLVATGRIALKQTDFGITPLSVLGGAIQVKDEVNVRFAIRAGAPH
jgi:polyisoprenoid-binding protein YceI